MRSFLSWLIAIAAIGFRAIDVFSQPSSMDGVWQLSSFWLITTGNWEFNTCFLNCQREFDHLAFILAPVLNLLGSQPIRSFYFIVFGINITLLVWALRRKNTTANNWLLLLPFTTIFFLSRTEDIALTAILASAHIIYWKPSLSTLISPLLIVICFAIHPVTGVMVGAYLILKAISIHNRKDVVSLAIITVLGALSLYLLYGDMYIQHLSNRESTRITILPQLLKGLLPIAFMYLYLVHKKGILLRIAACILLIILFGKAYYTAPLFGIMLFDFLTDKTENFKTRGYSAAKTTLGVLILLVYPVNKSIQWIENSNGLTFNQKCRKELRSYHFTGDIVFINPSLAEPIMPNSSVHFAIVDPVNAMIISHQMPEYGHQIVVRGRDQLEYLRNAFQHQIAVDSVIHGQKGFLSLSSGYQKRRDELNLYVVTVKAP